MKLITKLKTFKLKMPKLPKPSFKFKLPPLKIFRMLTLVLMLLACLMLLVLTNYGSREQALVASITAADDGITVTVLAGGERQEEVTVSGTNFIRRQIWAHEEDTHFFVILRRQGGKVFFERIQPLIAAELPGLNVHVPGGRLEIAAGTKPVLTEMVGLDWFVYTLSKPLWNRGLPVQSQVVYEEGVMSEVVHEYLQGAVDGVEANLYITDSQGRVVNLYSMGKELVTFPWVVRIVILVLLIMATVSALATLIVYCCSRRGRKGSVI